MIDEVQVSAGCIIHMSSDVTVVGVPSSCAKDRGTNSITVSFFDGTKADSNDLVPLSNGGLDLFFVEVGAGE